MWPFENKQRVHTPMLSQPLGNIVDGWKLKDGSLYLLVRCEEGVIRTVTLETR